MPKLKCPICGSKASPRHRGEPLCDLSKALRALDIPGKYAHSSCVISVLHTRVKTRRAQGHPSPVSNHNPSSLLTSVEGQTK